MECPQSNSSSTFYERIGLNRRRMPISASLELTMRCNLRCTHCYLGDHRTKPSLDSELSAAELCGIFDQLADAGTLWLLLTGGEPLLRPDFREIYANAKYKGFILTLFTNGTLLTPGMADFLADMPPHNTEISLYGATQETYERVTGIPGSFSRCRRGIDLLLERSIPLKLKAMAMTLTVAEIPAMQSLADSLGVEFRFDPILSNDLDKTETPFGMRLSTEEVIRLDLENSKRMEEWLAIYNQQIAIAIDQNYLYSCGAGINTCHIDPWGKMGICMSSRRRSYDLRKGTFQEGWEVFLRQVRYTPAVEESACSQCKVRPLCGVCPEWGETEHGHAGQPVKYLCGIGHRRAQVLGISL